MLVYFFYVSKAEQLGYNLTMNKTIGTFAPLSSLYTKSTQAAACGTIADGIAFLDWLEKNHQHAWQLLPLHQTHRKSGSTTVHVASPYKGYGIGIDPKYKSEYLPAGRQGRHTKSENFHDWLPDYALFCALRDHFGTDNWTVWDKDIRTRQQDAINVWRKKLEAKIDTYVDEQHALHKEYNELRKAAAQKKIALVGDLPFYLPLQSPLVWKYQHIFRISDDGYMPRVTGVANEPKATYGRQVWGHPLYRWDIPMFHRDIIELFKLRLSYLSELFDIVRIDHANGFFLYGSIDPLNEENDKIVQGPGFPVFKQIIHHCHEIALQVFAEDAAVELSKLRNAMEVLDVPGTRILRYAYNEKNDLFENDYSTIAAYPTSTYAYTTTHDTETLMGWAHQLTDIQRMQLLRKLAIKTPNDTVDPQQWALSVREALINSPSQTVIIPIQDWLLDTERINTPGTESEHNDQNWKYRVPAALEELHIMH
jgi:4-alpha-glucanotransferase